MADHSITISNYILSRGIGPDPVLWGTMEWGTDNWATTDEELASAHKVLADTIGSADTYYQYIWKVVSDTITGADSQFRDIFHVLGITLSIDDPYSKTLDKAPINNSITPSSDMTSMTVKDLVGYKYVFPDNTTDADDQVLTSYTAGSTPTASFTSYTAPSTEWS